MNRPSDVVVGRPPQGPVRFVAVVAAVTVPLAVAAMAMGDVGLGLAALVSAAWAGSLAYVGATARSRADDDGVEITWMRTRRSLRWDEVEAVEVDRSGGTGTLRSARLRLVDGGTVRWTPWIPFLWFAQRAANATVIDLGRLLASVESAPDLTDPEAPEDEKATEPRR